MTAPPTPPTPPTSPPRPTTSRPAEPLPRRSPLLLVLAPIPGLGHFAVNRAARGLLTFMVFAAGMNLVLMTAIWMPGRPFSPAWGWVLAGGAVFFSTVDVARAVLGRR